MRPERFRERTILPWNPESLTRLRQAVQQNQDQDAVTGELQTQYELALCEVLSRLTVLHAKLLKKQKLSSLLPPLPPTPEALQETVRDFICLTRHTLDPLSQRLAALERLL